MVTLQRWPGYKFIKYKFTLCPSLWAKNMGFISGTNLRELILFCCSLTCPKLCVAIVWAIFLSFPALIPHGWCPYHLTSAQDLRVWILFSLLFIYFFPFLFKSLCFCTWMLLSIAMSVHSKGLVVGGCRGGLWGEAGSHWAQLDPTSSSGPTAGHGWALSYRYSAPVKAY